MKVAAIVGPTAVGKTRVALDVAERLGAEIISVDSMQVYRGMDIGTDKATPDMTARVPHHLLDIASPSHDLTVAEFQAAARAAIDDITLRGRLPLLVGGSGLYFRAVVDELEFPPRAPEVRAALEEEAAEKGPEHLHQRLQELDPVAAGRIDPGNARRTIRALEVIELTGRKFSDNDAWERYESIYDLRVVGLQRSREELYARIQLRVADMLDSGLLEETAALARNGMSRTAAQALGYRQVLEAPDNASFEDIREDIVRASKRFARRQESWFRVDPRVAWVDASQPDLAEQVVAALQSPASV